MVKRFDGTIESAVAFMRALPETEAGCQLWPLGAATNNGYGRFNYRDTDGRQRLMLAHRASWSAANSCEIPAGACVMHSCDQPLCVNPAHLRLGTHADNMADMARKGRGRTGRHATYGAEQAGEMAALDASGVPIQEIAARFNVHRLTVRRTMQRHGYTTTRMRARA